MIEFTALSKSDWKQLVMKELKGQSFDSLNWQINDRICLDPYYTVDENDENLSALPFSTDVLIGEAFDCKHVEETNALLLQSLSGGLQSPLFIISSSYKKEDLTLILKEVDLNFISAFWNFTDINEVNKILDILNSVYNFSKAENQTFSGGIILNTGQIIQQYNELSIKYPFLKTISISASKSYEAEEVDIELADILHQIKELIYQLSPNEINKFFYNCFFNFTIGKNYLFEIARLRAFSYLWGNFQLSYGIEKVELPYINISFNSEAYDEDNNLNMIRATTMTMASYLGGASRITVLPTDHEESAFSRRIARNIQHLLIMESGFDKVQDPAAGSYYIEQLTLKIAESSWKIFTKE